MTLYNAMWNKDRIHRIIQSLIVIWLHWLFDREFYNEHDWNVQIIVASQPTRPKKVPPPRNKGLIRPLLRETNG